MLYIIFHEQTDAMHFRNVLHANLIECSVIKSPYLSNTGSCAWAVKVAEGRQEQVRRLCVSERIVPCGWHSGRKGKGK